MGKENEEVVDIDSTGEDSPEGKKVLDYSWAPSRLKGRKSTVQQIVQEEEEEQDITQEYDEVGKEGIPLEENEGVITLERKMTTRNISSLDTTESTPSFYEPPVDFSWEEQQETPSRLKGGKSTVQQIVQEEEEEEKDISQENDVV